ncbi:MAG: NADH-quinone oxidoreductase subunit J [Acidobacteria bacterium]|uniref:NADH-quinone oxidoreductase subunit J n=1 Tax=Candidatus Polarisedimenticola svalbardensis TaxID=2886004 RepID=A0A8J7CBZ9_9BACT|nr:NADH-quinone oxidoreductase subunit J [Candidatus Polarisedimenticola svalbardensis]
MTEVSLPLFLVFAAVGVFGAVMMVTRTQPVHSALYLVLTLFSVAAIYVLLHAEFLAVVQILVYAGGIMVLFLFVIFLVRPPVPGEARWHGGRHVLLSAGLAVILACALGWHFLESAPAAAGNPSALLEGGNMEQVSMTLFRYYILPFETVSILLLVSMIGAIALARKGEGV